MPLKILHRATGLTLRQYLKAHELRPVNWKPGPLLSFKEVTAHYLLSEQLLPGFYYHSQHGEGVVVCWLDGRDFVVRGVASVDTHVPGSEDAANKEVGHAQARSQSAHVDARSG